MQISNNFMDVFFGYNGRVGDVKGAKEGIAEFEQRAKNAESPEERERYAKAVEQLKTEILPKMQQEMEQLGKQLGLNSGQIGQVIEIDKDHNSVPNLAIKKNGGGVLSFMTSYESGSYYHNKI
ncbi:hypothetical protein [Pseudoalteromonas xiamenensis]|uniref:Uncharacterized protein n=1 Tax=Pseudoalteromonas xiamenensis TaxID=882626 RepID=A0A975HMM3_9GAMM|nr:hypothetical protein [Pseudoalteromonas xiamenensis]QTH73271.1 hypothetical protein J5O05_21070 [Pseudoalteromonas xiamenensis]